MSLRPGLAWLLLGWSPLSAQAPQPADILNQLVANAAQYNATLPSLTADELIESEASYRGLFPDKAKATATLRAIRSAPGEPLKESRQLLTVNGKPVDPDKKVRLPYTLFGGFGRFQEMFFTPQHLRCYLFTLLPESGPGGTIQIAISSPPDLSAVEGCDPEREGLTGLVRVDPVSRQLVHLERTVPADDRHKHLAPFASVDCAPTRVGDETFWLPTTVSGGSPKTAIRSQFVAHYSNYHRYTASIKLLPGATEVADPAVPDPASTPPPVSTPR
jgi:hypothetical protein